MTLFRFGHAQKNALAFFIAFALRQIAIRLCSLDFRLPIAFRDFDRLLMIFLLGSHAELKRNEQRFPSWLLRLNEAAVSYSVGRFERGANGRLDSRS